MKLIAIILAVLGVIGLAFGGWGLYTPGGAAMFDEMDGLYPFFGGVAGGICLFVAGIVLIVIARKGGRE